MALGLLVPTLYWVWKERPGAQYVGSIRRAEQAVGRAPYEDLTEEAIASMSVADYARLVLDRPIPR